MYINTNTPKLDPRGHSRSERRYRVNIPGQVEIVLPRLAGLAKKHCRVVDISTEGAGLIFEETFGLPNHFYLTIDRLFEKLGCAEVNRINDRVGIRFLRPLDDRWLKMTLGV